MSKIIKEFENWVDEMNEEFIKEPMFNIKEIEKEYSTMKKYRVIYYGWLPNYGDFDEDDFIVTAPNIKEAKKIMNEILGGILLKGNPSIELISNIKNK